MLCLYTILRAGYQRNKLVSTLTLRPEAPRIPAGVRSTDIIEKDLEDHDFSKASSAFLTVMFTHYGR